MSLSDWSSASLSSKPSPKAVPSESSTPLTLSDWLQKRKEDFKPENRIHGFVKQAEEAVYDDNYEDAVALYSNAIELSPMDSSLYANRSFCHQMLRKFELSLTDAQKAIELSDESMVKRQKTSKDPNKSSDSLKYRNKLMFYRKARALRELKRFQESIEVLVLSKSLAIECQFIDNEIKDIKLQVICDLGYDRPDVEEVSNQSDSIEELIKLLKQNKSLMIKNGTRDQLPSNPFGYRGLYVNGLAADLKEQTLEELLSSCGQLLRCKVYSNAEKSRAIIAFLEEQSVREAIRTIRSHEEIICDKFVDNLVFRYRHSCVEDGSDLRTDPQIHFKGTEIGGECFKWRTTGCDDNECTALHIPICNHLDQQSVEIKCVERKRQTIVFDSTSKSDSTPNFNKSIKSSDRQVIRFDTNGTESSETPKSLISPSKRLKTRIVFDIEGESQLEVCDKRLASSDHKVIPLKNGLETETNGLNSISDSPKTVRRERKRIVFDLIDVDKPNDSPIDNCLKEMKGFNSRPVRPSTPPNGRNVASYDDLFD